MSFFGEHSDAQTAGRFFVSNSLHGQGVVSPPHSHDYGCVHFVLDGQYCEKIGNETFEVKSGQALYKPPEAVHSNQFKHTFASTRRIEIHNHDQSMIRLPDRPMHLKDPWFAGLFSRLGQELQHDDDLTSFAIENISWEVMCQVVRKDRRSDGDSQRFENDRRVARAIEILEQQYMSPPKIGDLASSLNIHRSQLSRLFKKQTGQTFAAFVRSVRIQRAMKLLQETSMPLAEIAFECGFSDQSHFSRSFRTVTKRTPSEIRG